MPSRCFSPKYDELISSAIDAYWRDFHRFDWAKAQLCQESQLDPNAVSPVGAMGLGQVMPKTYQEIARSLHWDSAHTAFDPDRAVQAFAYYQGNSRRSWGAGGRTGEDRNRAGLCSYNAGFGNCLKAQAACHGALLWEQIAPCLESITGQFARETLTYVQRITSYAAEIGAPK